MAPQTPPSIHASQERMYGYQHFIYYTERNLQLRVERSLSLALDCLILL